MQSRQILFHARGGVWAREYLFVDAVCSALLTLSGSEVAHYNMHTPVPQAIIISSAQ